MDRYEDDTWISLEKHWLLKRSWALESDKCGVDTAIPHTGFGDEPEQIT